MKKIISFLLSLCIVLSLFVLSGCEIEIEPTEDKDIDLLKFKIFKIGRADCTVFRTTSSVVMIDTGEEDDGAEISEYLKKHGIKTVDCLFITHYDNDHIGGTAEILKHVKIKKVYLPKYSKDSGTYIRFMSALKEHNVDYEYLTENISLKFGTVTYNAYPAEKEYYKDNEDNEYSIIISVLHGKNSFLFTGDALTERLAEIMKIKDIKHNFLKVPNHGDWFKGLDEFFGKVLPEYSVITCSEKNPPNEKTLQSLHKYKSKVYLTMNGGVKVTSDGKDIIVIQ